MHGFFLNTKTAATYKLNAYKQVVYYYTQQILSKLFTFLTYTKLNI
jgi:hypothetical protein